MKNFKNVLAALMLAGSLVSGLHAAAAAETPKSVDEGALACSTPATDIVSDRTSSLAYLDWFLSSETRRRQAEPDETMQVKTSKKLIFCLEA